MATAATPTPEQIRRRSLQSGTIGAIVEWYEYTIYGVAAALVFGNLFFPNLSPGIGQIVSLASFGVGSWLARSARSSPGTSGTASDASPR